LFVDEKSTEHVTSETTRALLPATPEQFQYDPDGNLTSDGTWSYTWDAENRLVAMTNLASIPPTIRRALVFTYDYAGRRIQKDVFAWNPSTLAYECSSQARCVYDGWNLLAVLDAGK
jgi:YD repeat-containing protein